MAEIDDVLDAVKALVSDEATAARVTALKSERSALAENATAVQSARARLEADMARLRDDRAAVKAREDAVKVREDAVGAVDAAQALKLARIGTLSATLQSAAADIRNELAAI